jgi:hypothetical protein
MSGMMGLVVCSGLVEKSTLFNKEQGLLIQVSLKRLCGKADLPSASTCRWLSRREAEIYSVSQHHLNIS